MFYCYTVSSSHSNEGVRRVSDYVGNLQSPWMTPHRSKHPTELKDSDPLVAGSDPLMADSEPLVASSVRVFCAKNSQREGRSLPREGRGHFSQWDVGISVVFSTETTGSLRNPETRRGAAYPFLCSSINYLNHYNLKKNWKKYLAWCWSIRYLIPIWYLFKF